MTKYFCGVPKSGKTTKAMSYTSFEATNLKSILSTSGYKTSPDFYKGCSQEQLINLQTRMMLRLKECSDPTKVYDRACLDGLVYSAYYGLDPETLKSYKEMMLAQKGEYYIHLSAYNESDELGLEEYYLELSKLFIYYGKQLIIPGNTVLFIE